MLGVGSPSPGSARRHLELQRGEEALRHRVVPAVALAAHALHRAGAGEQLAEALRRELDAAVGVEEEPRTWLAPRQRAPQRFARQLCIEPVAHRPADDLAGEQVEDDDEEDEPAEHWQVRRVRDPGAVGRLSGEVALEQVGRDRLPMRRVGRAPPASPRACAQPLPRHRGRDALSARAVPAPAELLLDARRSVAAAQLREDRRHQHVELLLLERPPGRPAGRVCVMPGAGEPERPAHQRLRVVRLLRLDELEAHFPLLAKKAAAFRRKSRSIVTVFSSRRNRVFSARSSLVSGPCGSFLSSISALFTQARTLVSVSPSSRDTAPTLLPLVRISFITSALYSFVNDLLALAMDSILHHIGGVREIGAGSTLY